ncbi:hypothetical protein KDX38_15845 [Pseudomonas sp. CDFA 602]|uniref:hypothetical protein n=1 Tax=Pseudomonas californiensis TaxID=2829823 RepID=UPI001E4C4E3C|nr:hypothetical protein [Pseudomonas californiensis]MCD5994969.1 hypothetical protein [Pseudomonas californiensis]MCD6000680.1 hypothetical protein [Pseudomonas californiensis]
MAMIIIRVSLACLTWVVFCMLVMACISLFWSERLSPNQYGVAAASGLIMGLSSFRRILPSIFLAALSGIALGMVLTILIIGQYWPELPYEQALNYLLCAGLAGMVSGALIAQAFGKTRAKSRRIP